MSFEEHKTTLQHFVEVFNRGDLDIIDEMLLKGFWSYSPHPDEQNAS